MTIETYLPEQDGYYQLDIYASHVTPTRHILHSNTERALIIATLQDLLRTREPTPPLTTHKNLALHIHLLAFSIMRDSVSLLMYATSKNNVQNLGSIIVNTLIHFQQNEHRYQPRTASLRAHISSLRNNQIALQASLALHARHSDWEYDRYSSIGFYLHGRRGEWMHLWHLAPLYNSDGEQYRAMLKSVRTQQQ